jgi:four helix bundle protein
LIALKEARETVYWLRLISATAIVSPEKLVNLQIETEEISKIIGAIVIKSR